MAPMHGSFLHHMLPEVQVTAGLGFFLHSANLGVRKDCDILLYRLSLLAGPRWDSVEGVKLAHFIYNYYILNMTQVSKMMAWTSSLCFTTCVIASYVVKLHGVLLVVIACTLV